MSLTLYYVPASRAGRARWMLEELGVPYEIERVDVKAKANRSPEYLDKVHPLGHVPALRDGDMTMFESAAIVLYLADKFPEKKLAPPPGAPERGPYLQWAIYAMSELEPTVAAMSALNKIPESERDHARVADLRVKFASVAAPVTKQLAGREHLLGSEFTAADLLVAAVLGWAKVTGMLEDKPDLVAYVRRCTSRPASQRSRAD
jgi:glutathione S-transferase